MLEVPPGKLKVKFGVEDQDNSGYILELKRNFNPGQPMYIAIVLDINSGVIGCYQLHKIRVVEDFE